MIAALIAAARLCGAIVATWPDVPPRLACPAAVAIELERGSWDASILAAIAYRESRYQPTVVNAVTGCWGMYQTCGVRRRSDLYAQTRAAVRKLDEARAYCRHAGLLCTLAGYASGPAGVRGRWYRGPRRVMRDSARLREAVGRRDSVDLPSRVGS